MEKTQKELDEALDEVILLEELKIENETLLTAQTNSQKEVSS
jgi:hypothetical protein